MKCGVVIFPGSNCDQDVIHVLRNVMGLVVEEIWHQSTDLAGLTEGDFIVLPGGFSYGDYLRPGAISRFSPVMESVIRFAREGGFVLGICNGFQMLCEAQLLPGALVKNTNQKFICKNTFVRVEATEAPLTQATDNGDVLKIPVAHADGRYHVDDENLAELQHNKRILLRYCTEEGELTDHANVNGSTDHIAAICNQKGNVFGMMPHPERASEDVLNNKDGRVLFDWLLASEMMPT